MQSFLGCLLAAALGLALATLLVPGVQISGDLYQIIKIILLAGIVLGLLNFFIAPLLRLIAFPLRLLTLGLFGLIVEMVFIELVDIVFTPEITIVGFWPLFWSGLLVWVSTSVFAREKIWK
ncbi:MAG: phage holin family protein [Candidatus Pacebacteria bacterium]|nr:phage holin family protein [Candidatus Paceibacterota bacterium]